jgi:hypothetical protein
MTNLARIIVDHNKNFREKIKKSLGKKGQEQGAALFGGATLF